MIKNESKIYTACGDGKSPFVSAADIAAVAYRALIDETPHNCDYRVLGPELLTYDEVTRIHTSPYTVYVNLTERTGCSETQSWTGASN